MQNVGKGLFFNGRNRIKVWVNEGDPNYALLQLMEGVAEGIEGIDAVSRSKAEDAHLELAISGNMKSCNATAALWMKKVTKAVEGLPAEAADKMFTPDPSIESAMATSSVVGVYANGENYKD